MDQPDTLNPLDLVEPIQWILKDSLGPMDLMNLMIPMDIWLIIQAHKHTVNTEQNSFY